MKLDYIEIRTHDPERMKNFYISYLDASEDETFSCLKSGGSGSACILSFRGGFKIKLIPAEPDGFGRYTGKGNRSGRDASLLRLAFRVGNRKRVNELTCRLVMDGHEVISEPGAVASSGLPCAGRPRYASSVYDPDGNIIDLVS